MNNVVYLRHFLPERVLHKIEGREGGSWWVTRYSVAWDGSLLPGARLVFMAESETEAQAWIAAQVGESQEPLQQSETHLRQQG